MSIVAAIYMKGNITQVSSLTLAAGVLMTYVSAAEVAG